MTLWTLCLTLVIATDIEHIGRTAQIIALRTRKCCAGADVRALGKYGDAQEWELASPLRVAMVEASRMSPTCRVERLGTARSSGCSGRGLLLSAGP